MRIVAGAAKGRRLNVPAAGVRPTPDRVREALFSSLARQVVDAVMLDLFAGSGAVGLEALSRGAKRVTLIENDPKTAAVLRANVDAVGLEGAHVLTSPAERFLQQPAKAAYTVAFLDPPFHVPTDTLDSHIAALTSHLADGATVIVERGSKQDPPTFGSGFTEPIKKRYGSVTLYRAVWQPDASVHPDSETVETS